MWDYTRPVPPRSPPPAGNPRLSTPVPVVDQELVVPMTHVNCDPGSVFSPVQSAFPFQIAGVCRTLHTPPSVVLFPGDSRNTVDDLLPSPNDCTGSSPVGHRDHNLKSSALVQIVRISVSINISDFSSLKNRKVIFHTFFLN